METCDELKEKQKRKFSQAWLSDNRYKLWIRQVSSDNTQFYCNVCNKSFSCSSRVSKHADSACHKKNIEKTTCPESEHLSKKEYDKRTFRQQWLDIHEYKKWLREDPNNMNAFLCIICDRSICLSSCGLSQIHRHAESQMHKNKYEKSDIGANKSNKDLNTQTIDSLLTFDEEKKSAEIRFAAFITEKNIPYQTAEELLNLFQDIGTYPNVLKSMRIDPTKCTKFVLNIFCPIEIKREVLTELETPTHVSLSTHTCSQTHSYRVFATRTKLTSRPV